MDLQRAAALQLQALRMPRIPNSVSQPFFNLEQAVYYFVPPSMASSAADSLSLPLFVEEHRCFSP